MSTATRPRSNPTFSRFGYDPSTVRHVDKRPQAAQAPPQRGTRIIRDIPEHGRELGVRYVLEGSVRKSGRVFG
jgi:hypothetical protein